MKLILAQPRGFCAGVVRAIDIVERALAKHEAPVYVRHEIVHNRYVVENLKAKGARFVEELADVPAGATTIFSAHGVSRPSKPMPQRAGSTFSMPRVRSSPKSTTRDSAIPILAGRSS